LLMPLSTTAGAARGDRIENITSAPRIGCSDQLLGRVVNGFGKPIDGKGALNHQRKPADRFGRGFADGSGAYSLGDQHQHSRD